MHTRPSLVVVVVMSMIAPSACQDSTKPNTPPIAVAGPDQAVNVGETVTLNGSGSTDPDGEPLTYSWSVLSAPAGSGVTLSGASSVSASFAPDVGGEFLVQLTVSDGNLTASDECTVFANARPSADAGPDQFVDAGEVVELDATNSTDPEGGTLTYSWTMVSSPSGSNTTVDGASSANASFIPDLGGEFLVRLTVSDGEVTARDDCIITANGPPVAEAGPDQFVDLGDEVHFDGTPSTDPEGSSLSYSWSIRSQPPGSSVQLSSEVSSNPSLTPNVGGIYVIELVVSDGSLLSHPDSCIVDVNRFPIADAGPDDFATAGELVLLDGTASSDPDGDDLTFNWFFTSRPAGSNAALSEENSAHSSFTPDVEGEFIVGLLVGDGRVTSEEDVCSFSAQFPLTVFDNGSSSGPQSNTGNMAGFQELFEDFQVTQNIRITGITWQQHDHVESVYENTEIVVFSGMPQMSSPVFSDTVTATRIPNSTPVLFNDWNGFDYEITGLSIDLPPGDYWVGVNANYAGQRPGWDNTTGGPNTVFGYRVIKQESPPPGRVSAGNLAFSLLGFFR